MDMDMLGVRETLLSRVVAMIKDATGHEVRENYIRDSMIAVERAR